MNGVIVAALAQSIGFDERDSDRVSRQQREIERVRAALGDAVVPIRLEEWQEFVAAAPMDVGHDKLAASLPVFDPPLSDAVSEDREDRV